MTRGRWLLYIGAIVLIMLSAFADDVVVAGVLGAVGGWLLIVIVLRAESTGERRGLEEGIERGRTLMLREIQKNYDRQLVDGARERAGR